MCLRRRACRRRSAPPAAGNSPSAISARRPSTWTRSSRLRPSPRRRPASSRSPSVISALPRSTSDKASLPQAPLIRPLESKPPTVSDISAATMDFGQDASAADSTSRTKADHTGMTIQSGRWSPSAEELASSPGVYQTLDSSFLGRRRRRRRPRHAARRHGNVGQQPRDQRIGHGRPGGKAGRQPASLARPAPAPSARASLPSSSSIASKARWSFSRASCVPKSSAPTRTAQRIDYNLLKKLGEGGMGIVYAARQQSIRRVVALKMLKKAGEQESFQREKFLAEAVITGDLEHPNIVPDLRSGPRRGGRDLLCDEACEGHALGQARSSKNSLHENLEILMKVADAVGLRPFARRRASRSQARKRDARRLRRSARHGLGPGPARSSNPPADRRDGRHAGYMAPEMAMGPIDASASHSDVYLLGAILFEIVTGLRPHTGKTVTRCLMAAAKNEIVPTRKSGELVDIALQGDGHQAGGSLRRASGSFKTRSANTSRTSKASPWRRGPRTISNEARRTDSYDTYARALFALSRGLSLWDGNTRARAGAVEAALAYAESAERKGDFDLGLSLLDKNEPRHAELIERLHAGPRRARIAPAPLADRPPRRHGPGRVDLRHRDRRVLLDSRRSRAGPRRRSALPRAASGPRPCGRRASPKSSGRRRRRTSKRRSSRRAAGRRAGRRARHGAEVAHSSACWPMSSAARRTARKKRIRRLRRQDRSGRRQDRGKRLRPRPGADQPVPAGPAPLGMGPPPLSSARAI